MNVHELMSKNVVTAFVDTPLSQILAEMQHNRIHQIPVLSEEKNKVGGIAGIVILDKLITKEFDISKTTAKSILKSTPKILPYDTLEKAIELIVDLDQRAIPVFEDKLVGIISEGDMLIGLTMDGIADDVAKPLTCVDEKTGVGKVKEMLANKNWSRIGITDAKNPRALIGVAGTLDLIKSLGTAQGGQRDRGEAAKTGQAPISNFMHTVPIIEGGMALNDVIELLKTNEEVVVRQGSTFGMITAKKVLRAYLSDRSVDLVQIVGLDKEDSSLDIARVRNKAAQIIEHISRFSEMQPMKIYIKQHRKQGPKIRYSVKAELVTDSGRFVADSERGTKSKSFDLTTVVQDVLEDIERMAKKTLGKTRKPDRAWISAKRSEKEEGIMLRDKRRRN